jgi:hypothetical protein
MLEAVSSANSLSHGENRMSCFARLLSATIILMSVFAGTAFAQTQPQMQTLGTSRPDPEAGARWKTECERRADEKQFRGKKRAAVVAKCVKMGSLPRELQ